MNVFYCGWCGEGFPWDPGKDDHPYPAHAREKHVDKHCRCDFGTDEHGKAYLVHNSECPIHGATKTEVQPSGCVVCGTEDGLTKMGYFRCFKHMRSYKEHHG